VRSIYALIGRAHLPFLDGDARTVKSTPTMRHLELDGRAQDRSPVFGAAWHGRPSRRADGLAGGGSRTAGGLRREEAAEGEDGPEDLSSFESADPKEREFVVIEANGESLTMRICTLLKGRAVREVFRDNGVEPQGSRVRDRTVDWWRTSRHTPGIRHAPEKGRGQLEFLAGVGASLLAPSPPTEGYRPPDPRCRTAYRPSRRSLADEGRA